MSSPAPGPRIGIGTDVHRLAPGRPMRIAGLDWPGEDAGRRHRGRARRLQEHQPGLEDRQVTVAAAEVAQQRLAGGGARRRVTAFS